MSGDSVLQGVGMPSCIEKVAKSRLVSIWNLSTGNYGPHEKTQALLTYGISKKPKWLILEFFSGNDVSDANEDDVLAFEGQTFEGRFAKEETLVYFAISPKYRGIVNHDVPVDRYTYQLVCFVKLTRLNNLTFSFTHEIATKIMKAFRRNRSKAIGPDIGNDKIRRVAYPAEAHFDIVPDKYSDWVLLGLENTLRHYRRFINEVRKLDNPPQIALLYNPSSYEIYRNLLIDQDGSRDALADMQWHALRAFANENGITFIDLLPLLRKRVAEVQPPIWLYGKNDLVHWSQAGTDVVADVLKKEFDRIVIS